MHSRGLLWSHSRRRGTGFCRSSIPWVGAASIQGVAAILNFLSVRGGGVRCRLDVLSASSRCAGRDAGARRRLGGDKGGDRSAVGPARQLSSCHGNIVRQARVRCFRPTGVGRLPKLICSPRVGAEPGEPSGVLRCHREFGDPGDERHPGPQLSSVRSCLEPVVMRQTLPNRYSPVTVGAG